MISLCLAEMIGKITFCDLGLYQARGIGAVSMKIVQLQLVMLPETDETNVV